MSSSDLSSLSSAESIETDDEILAPAPRAGNLDRWLKDAGASSSPPPKRKRTPSPPHEYVLADNPDIAFIVMFRSRFSEAFPRSAPQLGPQDVERGIVDAQPDEHVEKLLCGLIGIVLNRKKDVEKGHYTRALEEAIQTNAHQWPREWEGNNPLHGGGSFNNMSPKQRLVLMRALILWALNSSDAIQTIIKESYKQQRHDDDLNQPLSVQPWGRDSDKRRYWLIEGREDTHFRLYRENNGLRHRTWWSIADSIPAIKEVAEKLNRDGTQASRRLHDKIHAAIPRFEAGEDKRKRRDYRLARKAQFTRPEPGFSLYEGRTRGKRVKYTFSDEEGEGSDALSVRRSTRQSGVSTPAEGSGPTFTASGRQVRSRLGGLYGETMHSGQQSHQAGTDISDADPPNGVDGERSDNHRALRGGRGPPQPNGRPNRSRAGYELDNSDESDAVSTGDEWQGGDDEAEDNMADDDADADEDTDMSDVARDDEDDTGRSLIVSLKIPDSRKDELQSKINTRGISEGTEELVVLLPPKNSSASAPAFINGDPTAASQLTEADTPAQNDVSMTSEAPSTISQTQGASSVTSFTPTEPQPSKPLPLALLSGGAPAQVEPLVSAPDRDENLLDADTEVSKPKVNGQLTLSGIWQPEKQQEPVTQRHGHLNPTIAAPGAPHHLTNGS